MQLTKNVHSEQNSNFSDREILQDLSSLLNTQYQRKTSSSLKNHEELTPSKDQRSILSNIDSNQFTFYQQYKKIYTVSHHLSLQKDRQNLIFKSLVKDIRCLEERMKNLQQIDFCKKDQFQDENRVKRSRRTAELIDKKYKCDVMFCQRLYGSEGSLQQHIKLKHPELYQKLHYEDSIMGLNSNSMF